MQARVHTGSLWSSTGTRHATATFTGETASGWQQVTFAQPVVITAGTVYVASYFCPGGHYSFDVDYFAARGVDHPPLHALASNATSPNGVYAYGATSTFPSQTYAATNYWVDVVFGAGAAGSIGVTSLAASSLAPATRPAAEHLELGDDGYTDATRHAERRVETTAAHAGRGGSVRRFTLQRTGDGYRVSALGRFVLPAGTDLASTGMSVVFEDGARRDIAALRFAAGDLVPTATGWQLGAPTDGVERFTVRRRRGRAIVGLVAMLPPFDLGDAGMLRWRVAFGPSCAGALPLVCTDDAGGQRRCHRESTAAHSDRPAEAQEPKALAR